MNGRPKYCWRQRLYRILRYYFRQGLSETTKIVMRSGRQSNPGLPECEVGTAKNSATAFGLCVGLYDVMVWFDGRVQLASGYRLVFVTTLSCNVACTCQSSRHQSDVNVTDRSYVPKSVMFRSALFAWKLSMPSCTVIVSQSGEQIPRLLWHLCSSPYSQEPATCRFLSRMNPVRILFPNICEEIY